MKFKRIRESIIKPAPIKQVIESVDTEAHLKAAERYRQLASIEAGTEINEETLDKHLLSQAACECGIPSGELKETLLRKNQLTEDADAEEQKVINSAPVQQAARQLKVGDEEIVVLDFPSLDDLDEDDIEDIDDLEHVLDRALKQAKLVTGRKNPKNRLQIVNVLVVGQAGTGKSSVIKKWASERGVHLAEYDLATLNPEDMGGAVMPDPDNPRMIIHAMSSSTWKNLSQPNTVLFLDEYNRAKSSIRSTVMKLVNDHILPGPDGTEQYMPNILFTIAAINPATSSYSGVSEMDRAEQGRFETVYMTVSKTKTLKVLDAAYGEMVEEAIAQGDAEQALEYQGRRALARAILSDRRFQFTSPDDEEEMSDDSRFRATTPRHLEIAISASDGTKEGLLRVWNRSCDHRQKKTIEDILQNFQDVKDKANDALKVQSKSKVFAKELDNLDKIRQRFPGII